jgi:hypothetical protein
LPSFLTVCDNTEIGKAEEARWEDAPKAKKAKAGLYCLCIALDAEPA